MDWKNRWSAEKYFGKDNGNKRYTVIAGCGRLGAGIAGMLSDEKQDVMILDIDKSAFRKLPPSYSGLTMAAGAADLEKLEAAQLHSAEAFIAVTDNDNVNICAAQLAKRLFHVPRVVARIYDDEKLFLLKDMQIDTICPTRLSEKEISHYINIGGQEDA